MKKRKIFCAALAAIMAVGSMSVASYAETDEIREDSKYEITLEKEIIDGEEKAVVVFSGLPKEALTFDYSHKDEYNHGDGNMGQSEFGGLSNIVVVINNEDVSWGYIYGNDDYNDKNKEYKWQAGTITGNFYVDIDTNNPTYPVIVEEGETTLTLKAYFDPNDEKIKSLDAWENTTVCTYVCLHGASVGCYDKNGDGQMTPDEEYTWGDSTDFIPIVSSRKMILNCTYEISELPKERVKITNNLNAPATSAPATEPAESDVTPGETDEPADRPLTPGSTDTLVQLLEVTLKNVDSVNGIEGEALDKLLFGNSGWTWDQVDKIEFSSDDLFSVQYKNDNGDWVKLGEETAAKADDDNIWNTEWTLNTSDMPEKKYTKVIAKDGTIDVNAKIYLKHGAEKPGADQQPTGIALAVAPVVLAAGAAIVVLRKKK